MLYAQSRSCVHTYTKATYDVHDVFSVHVCRSHMDRIICSLLCDCLFPPLFSSFYFRCIQTVYTAYEHRNCLDFTGIWHGCLDIGYFTKYTSGISYILMEIPTYYYHADGTQRYLHLTVFHYMYCVIVPWLYPFHCIYSGTPCTHCVDIVALVLRIRNVYIWYIYSTHFCTKRYIVYTTCIHPVSFTRLHIRPSHIYAFSNITFSYCPSRLRMLAII